MTDHDDAWLRIDSIDLEAQGVARRADGKVVFVDGALPAEEVQVRIVRRKNQWERGVMTALRHESALRVHPPCPHFGLHPGACGGCRMQHLDTAAQVAIKQRALEDSLCHLAKVKPDRILPPIVGPAWGYRWRARLAVRHVARKGTVLVGFHERNSRYVADMTVCPVLPGEVGALLVPLRELVGAMALRERIPQIEVAVGEGACAPAIALVLRHLDPIGEPDLARLCDFAARFGVQWWLQPGGPDTVHRLDREYAAPLAYTLPEFGLRMQFAPTDFTQVNPGINRVLVGRAIRLLDPAAGERVIDWFCGLGNFSLPIATRARQVLGVEGNPMLVERARHNARLNALEDRARFDAMDLFALPLDGLVAIGRADKWLVDPPREGAFALVKALAQWQASPGGDWSPPGRIVYVSCNPATLARDAGLLVHQAGYRCTAAGVVNMFAHTAHVESIACFDRV